MSPRGLDVVDLPYVINTEVPLEKESYLHRAGRVGRMGKEGTVVTIVQDHSLKDLKNRESVVHRTQGSLSAWGTVTHRSTCCRKRKQERNENSKCAENFQENA